ncbi:hypothetical protein [Longilinea arvoryzae]|nr:hypothetical protein [Longilinea arvoryzae]
MEEDEVRMPENAKVQLKWVYTPTDFFEEKETTLLPDYEHTIENGEVTVSMDLNEYQSLPGTQEQLHNLLIGIFRGAALVSQKPFTLKAGGQETIYPDGRRDVSLQIDSAVIKMTAGTIDIIVKDQNGQVIADSKQERLNKRRRLSILSAKYRDNDPVVESILSSFEKSLNNPETALVHLYEIRDALAKKFSGEAIAKRELGISSSKWSRLGRLANDEPLNQGRHNGVHIGALRDATNSELEEARNIAIEMVVAYLEYLKTHPPRLP